MKAFSKSIADQIKDELKTQNELIGRARMISPEALEWTQRAFSERQPIEKIRTHLLDLVAPLGKVSNAQDAPIRSFKQITDDDFFEGLKNPAPHPLDTPSAGRTEGNKAISFRDISDDDFFEGLKNPSKFPL